MAQKFRNNAASSLGVALSDSDTTLTLQSGHGARFPEIIGPDFTWLVLEDAAGNLEVIKVSAHAAAALTMTIERGQQGTAARAWAMGDLVELRPTASEATNWETAYQEFVAAKGAAPSLAAAVLRYVAGLTATLQANGFTVTGLAAPSAPSDACTRAYADGLSFAAALPSQTGKAGRMVRTDGSDATWEDPWGPVSSLTGAAGLALRTAYHVDTSGGAFACTLPAGAAGDWVLLRDTGGVCAVHNLTLTPTGGNLVHGAAQDYVMDVSGESVLLIVDATKGWVRG